MEVRQNLTLNYGLRYSINDEPFFIRTDKNDLQPRFGEHTRAILSAAGFTEDHIRELHSAGIVGIADD
ncbi:MAG TPA: hypothetical protein VD966_00820 [Pyrinomonadaceae bacterium]|nr:hypothetical protein [Pyrinomonadaceae bacterium]